MKKVLVTGASGFLRGRLCHALLDQGYYVRALIWHKETNLSAIPSTTGTGVLELVYGDVTDLHSLIEAFRDCAAVFHLAAMVDVWHPNPSLFMSNILRAFKETKNMEKIIYTSSFFAIGPTDGHVADESQVHPEKLFCSEYEKSKVIADKIALQAASEGLPIIPVYPGVMYGAGNITADCGAVQRKIAGTGYDRFSFSHVDDVAAGHIAAFKKGRMGERSLIVVKKKQAVYTMKYQWAYSCEKGAGLQPKKLGRRIV